MKVIMKSKVWKVLISIIIILPIITSVAYVICSTIENMQISNNQKLRQEAHEAGYKEEYYICTLTDEISLEGVDYTLYTARRDVFVGESYKEEILVKKDAAYIDKTKGKKEGLIIYGNIEGFANDPDDDVVYNPGKYAVINPYKIAIYKQSIDMWAGVGLLIIAVMIEIGLVIILALYCVVMYRKQKIVT